MIAIDPFDWLEPAMRPVARREVLRFVADCEALVDELVAGGAPPSAVLVTLDQVIDAYVPLLTAQLGALTRD